MGRILAFEMLYGLKVWIWANDHFPPHVHVYKGNPNSYEATLKLRIDTWEVISSSGFSERSVKKITEFLKKYEDILLYEWEVLHGKN
jgi:hypothetical protein